MKGPRVHTEKLGIRRLEAVVLALYRRSRRYQRLGDILKKEADVDGA